MNIRKLLFVLSTLTLVGAPVISIVSCNASNRNEVGIADLRNLKFGDWSNLQQSQVNPAKPEAVTVQEITKYINISVQQGLNKMLAISDALMGTDYQIAIFKIDGEQIKPIAGVYDFTTDTQSDRSFAFKVIAISNSKKLKGESDDLQVAFFKIPTKQGPNFVNFLVWC